MSNGMIPSSAPPILERLEVSSDLWLLMLEKFGKRRTVTPLVDRQNTAEPVASQATAI